MIVVLSEYAILQKQGIVTRMMMIYPGMRSFRNGMISKDDDFTDILIFKSIRSGRNEMIYII